MTANSNGDRSLPFSEDDEKGLLCSQLREPANVWDICADRNLRPDAFYFPAHRILYSILVELSKDAQCIAADGKIDFVPLKRVLKDRGQLEEIGGEPWLSALYDFVPTAANAAWYADIIRDRWERRRAISDGKQQIHLASDLSVDNWDADGKYQSPSPAPQLIEFLSPSEIVSYQAPPGIVLVGDQHIFVMQSASDDLAEDRIVWTCCKNNDGELGDRSAWVRCNGLFDPVSDFDWDAWNNDGQGVKIGIKIVPKIIEESGGAVARDILRDKIEGKGLSRRTAYRRIEEAEKLKLIKFQKGKDAYELY